MLAAQRSYGKGSSCPNFVVSSVCNGSATKRFALAGAVAVKTMSSASRRAGIARGISCQRVQ